MTSGTRIKRAAASPVSQREATEAKKPLGPLGRRVPPFPGTGRTQAVPLLPSLPPRRSLRPKN